LRISELACVRGDKHLFSGLSFDLAVGGALFVHGPNGSGKTTLLRTICGLILPEEGEITWDNVNMRKLGDDYFSHLSYMGHLNGLKDELTGIENLMVSSRLAGVFVTESQVSDVLARLGVENCQDLPTKFLSQGQKKRTALARFMLNKTKLWVLDEPFTALDIHAVDILLNVIEEHVNQGGMAILTTHQEVTLAAESAQHIYLN